MSKDSIVIALPHWISGDLVKEFFVAANTRPLGLGKNPTFWPLLREMRGAVPVEGNEWVKDIHVLIEPGQGNHQGQENHTHPEWTAIFYVQPGDPVVPINIEGQDYHPNPGDLVVLPPYTQHGVAKSHSTIQRLSFAMLVADPGIHSKFKPIKL